MKKIKIAHIVANCSKIKGRFLVRAKIELGEKKGPKERLYLLHPLDPKGENNKRKHFYIKKKDGYYLRLQALNTKGESDQEYNIEDIIDIQPFELT